MKLWKVKGSDSLLTGVGCDYVLHIASPVAFLTSDPMKQVVQPAIDGMFCIIYMWNWSYEGTLNVLRSCSKSGTVKKVVLTSSIWAVTSWSEDRGKNYVFTEKDWNDYAVVKYSKFPVVWGYNFIDPYAFSKKAAEQAAWAYVKEHPDFALTTIIPGKRYVHFILTLIRRHSWSAVRNWS
jgi:anthocyanidin reductase